MTVVAAVAAAVVAVLASAVLVSCEPAPAPRTAPQPPATDDEGGPTAPERPETCIWALDGSIPQSGLGLLGSWNVTEPDGVTYTLHLAPSIWRIENGPPHLHPGGDRLSTWSYGPRRDAFGSPQGMWLSLHVSVAPLPLRDWRLVARSGGGYCLGSGHMVPR